MVYSYLQRWMGGGGLGMRGVRGATRRRGGGGQSAGDILKVVKPSSD